MDRRSLLAAGAATAALAATGTTAEAEAATPSDAELARSLGFRSAYADVNGTRLHYVIGGKGSPLMLLGGWPQTWWQFRKIMPALAERYRVIVADLRGMNLSGKPAGGYDKKTMARDIYELVKKLGYTQVDIAGHDIGAMVGHAFAANYPHAIRKLALIDVPHPDEGLYELTLLPQPTQFHLWWFAFNQVQLLPEQLLAGRFRLLVDHLCGLLLQNQAAITDRDRAIYARAYASPDAIRASNGWYQTFGQDIVDGKTYPRLTLPVLGLASEPGFDYLAGPLRRQAVDVQLEKISGAGHYVAEEQPEAVVTHLRRFFG
ncbi:pimeloyl-ACP methyl ester carboxylesterase [Kibdelosporangium banguiense]|uniref:Pimeloyl-ACP methyl ester carboxylesterase n=1 Tax=Kibdelosporangium banguiense TaxID=1365924 RepID=A0ABS4TZL5_9PSEU|nr:alpha/beta hydrolase [Kibdelosporangium banguiense]MBP2329849.1 pimeloyl-ACP methyl ester carboxylesterase [Kibdelosporangium banguiense]